jgi:hypothetical protein
MSDLITTAFVQEYKMGVELLAQQEGSVLRDAVRYETQNAESDFYDQIASTEAVEVTTRHGDTPLVNSEHRRRRNQLRFFDWADLIDKKDKIQLINDPEGPYVQNAGFAMGRALDTVIIQAFFASSYTGKTGSTAVTFPSSTHEVASGSVGLTVAKLRAARKILRSRNIPRNEPIYAAVTAQEIDDLLGTTEVTSSDYNSVKALVDGNVDTFMGIKFIHTELVEDDGTTRSVPIWAKNGVLVAANPEFEVDIGPRRDKRNSIQVYVSGNFGSTRMDEDRVVRVLCTL